MKQSSLIYCSCSHKIWCEVRYEADLVILIFFDDEETSETYAEQITHCPGCGGQSFVEGFLEEPTHTVVVAGSPGSRGEPL